MDQQFDTVLVVNTLEHVLDGFDFLTSIYKTIRPGGTLILPNASLKILTVPVPWF
jgi:2-polyprenyl-3-methyl-5-hydroxy-6-metoxy-1,4-benzoquinol methylase